jgi:uncharacterized membrane protein YqjE
VNSVRFVELWNSRLVVSVISETLRYNALAAGDVTVTLCAALQLLWAIADDQQQEAEALPFVSY